jgi:hypothetical protein
MIKQFIKHVLTEKKRIIIFYLGILTFVTACDIKLFEEIFYGQMDAPVIILFTLFSLNVIILPACIYHPYKEWKDGL